MASLCYAATGISFTCSMCLVSYHSQILNSKKLKGAKKEENLWFLHLFFDKESVSAAGWQSLV